MGEKGGTPMLISPELAQEVASSQVGNIVVCNPFFGRKWGCPAGLDFGTFSVVGSVAGNQERSNPEMKKEDRAMMNDAQLQQDVMDELKWEPTIHAAEVGVAVKDGVVTLSGSVDSYAKVWAVDRAVKRVLGVRGVVKDIKVILGGPHKVSDEEVAQLAKQVLAWNYWVPKNCISLAVENGQITLSGTVDWYYQKERAEESVRHLVGVIGVTNWITIKPSVPDVNELVVRTRIESALRRNARLLLASQKIQVASSGSKVILMGSVGSLAEREEAEASAWSAPGVSQVENNLSVV
jgi:osmotically-inducible protein OsmY